MTSRSPELMLLQADIMACRSCLSLAPWRQFERHVCGNPATGCLLVGEAPGVRSLHNRRRFTGPAGLLIRRALSSLAHPTYRDLEDLFYLTDVVKCHPAARGTLANRSPTRREVQQCEGFLLRELDVLVPRIIVTFGKTAAEAAARLCRQSVSSRRLYHFPHPSPRNRAAILKHYPSMDAFEHAIAQAFRQIIQQLETGYEHAGAAGS